MEETVEQLKADVLDEVEAIEQVLKDLSFLKSNLESDETDTVQKAAVGTFLLNFYVGIENIVKRKAKNIIERCPRGAVGIRNFLTYLTLRHRGKFLFSAGILRTG